MTFEAIKYVANNATWLIASHSAVFSEIITENTLNLGMEHLLGTKISEIKH